MKFYQTKPTIILIISLLIFAGLACEFSAGDTGGVASINQATSCKAVDDDQQCEGQADLFDGSETVYVSVQVANLAEGDRVTARWFQGTDQITEFTYTAEQPGDGHIAFHISPEPVLPSGDYAAQIFLNDGLAQTVNFQVEGAEARIVSLTTCKAVDDDNKCRGHADTFEGTETIYASVEVENLSIGDQITAQWLQGTEQLNEFTFTADSFGSGYIYFSLSPDTSLAPGAYTVQILFGDSPPQTAGFQISEPLAETADLNALVVEDVVEQTSSGWQTFDSEDWLIRLDYPGEWTVDDGDDGLAFLGQGKTLFYLTGYAGEGSPAEENQSAIETALDSLSQEFGDFQFTDVETFTVGNSPGLTSDYAYTDNGGDYLNGSLIVGTSDSGNTYIIYIEALADDYGAALDDFNGMLQTLVFN